VLAIASQLATNLFGGPVRSVTFSLLPHRYFIGGLARLVNS